jgi:hypothetical protein
MIFRYLKDGMYNLGRLRRSVCSKSGFGPKSQQRNRHASRKPVMLLRKLQQVLKPHACC